MNSLQELQEKYGINESTAVRMITEYKSRIGEKNGDYTITDINYVGNATKIVEETCSHCGAVITREMVNGRNKWSELQKFCPNEQKERKQERHFIRQQNIENERSKKIECKRNALLNEVGNIYGEFTIISTDGISFLTGKCNICGAEKSMNYDCIISCMRKDFICHKHRQTVERFTEYFIGKKNNMLEVIDITHDENSGRKRFLCRCDCGNICMVKPTFWETGKVKSCGCLFESKKVLHTPELDRLRRIRNGMINRCYNKNDEAYKYYGHRGIIVCDEWIENFDKFAEWALSNGYRMDLTIDRINNDGNYCPENCHWATYKEQSNNQRERYTAKIYNLDGIDISLSDIGELYGVKPYLVSRYIKQNNTLEQSINLAIEKEKEDMGRPTTEKKDIQVTIRVSKETRDKLDEKARLMGMNLSEYLRKVIKEQV